MLQRETYVVAVIRRERGIKAAGAIVDLATFGNGAILTNAAKKGVKEFVIAVAKTMAVDALASGATYLTGEMLEELGMPPGTAIIMTAIVSGTVTYAAGKYFFKDELGNVIAEYTGEELDKVLKGEMDDILPEISAVKGNAVDELIEGGTGDFDLSKLSRSQQKAIESADNIINGHLKSSDLSAALGDLQGNPIAKPNGGYWNHAQEVKDAYTGLVRAEKTLAGSLQNPNLAPDVKSFIQGKYDSIRNYISVIEEMFAPYGGIN